MLCQLITEMSITKFPSAIILSHFNSIVTIVHVTTLLRHVRCTYSVNIAFPDCACTNTCSKVAAGSVCGMADYFVLFVGNLLLAIILSLLNFETSEQKSEFCNVGLIKLCVKYLPFILDFKHIAL